MGTITVANTSGNLSEFSSLQPHSLTMDMYNPLPHFFFFWRVGEVARVLLDFL